MPSFSDAFRCPLAVMRGSALVAACMLVGCSGSSSSAPPPTIYGNWIYTAAGGTSGVALSVARDGTYALSSLAITSATAADAQVERGTFVASGSTIVTTPTEWTCPGPDPVTTLTYAFVGANLELELPTGIVELEPNTATPDGPLSLTYGCFAGGTFRPAPLAPVSN